MHQKTPSQLRHEKLKQHRVHTDHMHVDGLDDAYRRMLVDADAGLLPVLEIIKLSIQAGELSGAVSAVCKASVELQNK